MFTGRQVRFLYLYTKIWVLPTHKVNNVFFSIGTNQRKSCNLKNNKKSHVFIFYRFFIFASKFVLYLLTQFKMFSSSESTNHRNRCTYKNNINLILSFLQCALPNSVIFTSNFVFFLLKKKTMFSSSKVTYQINRCTFKTNIKSHIFIFTVRPVRFLFLQQSLCLTYSHSLQLFFSSNGTYIRKRCTFKTLLKSHIFNFYSAPCQISLSLHQSLCFTY